MKTFLKMIASPFELFTTDPWDTCGFVLIIVIATMMLGVN